MLRVVEVVLRLAHADRARADLRACVQVLRTCSTIAWLPEHDMLVRLADHGDEKCEVCAEHTTEHGMPVCPADQNDE